jgi:hypothetical protein
MPSDKGWLYKTIFGISHHYNKTLGSADVQFFFFCMLKGWNGINNAFDVPKLEHLNHTPANTPFH